LTRFIERRLKLQVNAQKSAVARPWQRSFLGFTVTDEVQPRRRIAEKALARFKDRVRDLTRRHRGVSLQASVAIFSPKGPWRLSSSSALHRAFSNKRFKAHGLVAMETIASA
jgi:hypothetical protein